MLNARIPFVAGLSFLGGIWAILWVVSPPIVVVAMEYEPTWRDAFAGILVLSGLLACPALCVILALQTRRPMKEIWISAGITGGMSSGCYLQWLFSTWDPWGGRNLLDVIVDMFRVVRIILVLWAIAGSSGILCSVTESPSLQGKRLVNDRLSYSIKDIMGFILAVSIWFALFVMPPADCELGAVKEPKWFRGVCVIAFAYTCSGLCAIQVRDNKLIVRAFWVGMGGTATIAGVCFVEWTLLNWTHGGIETFLHGAFASRRLLLLLLACGPFVGVLCGVLDWGARRRVQRPVGKQT